MCDIWRANDEKREITAEELSKHMGAFRKLGVKRVALSGGEALMHSNLWKLCNQLAGMGAKISLLTTGLTLKAHASNVIEHVHDVIVSIDGSRDVHNRIRNIPGAFEKLEAGVKHLKMLDPKFKITGRTVLQKQNFADFNNLIQAAVDMGLDQISFLPADVSSQAFNRSEPWNKSRVSEVALNEEELYILEKIIEASFARFRSYYENRFIAESPAKMKEIVAHYRAILGLAKFPGRKCNAPWVSAVVEPDGAVRPCFFHSPNGYLGESDFEALINSDDSIRFRKQLNVKKDPVCQRCVCSLHVGVLQTF